MARLIFGETSPSLLSAELAKQVPLARPQIEALRQRRSPKYVEALKVLDSGGHVAAPSVFEELRQSLSEQFPHGPDSWPRGWVAACCLGPPYQVHILDFAGEIVRHFKRGEPMPEPLEQARSLASHPRYAFVEVYSDRLVAVGQDGSTSICQIQGART